MDDRIRKAGQPGLTILGNDNVSVRVFVGILFERVGRSIYLYIDIYSNVKVVPRAI